MSVRSQAAELALRALGWRAREAFRAVNPSSHTVIGATTAAEGYVNEALAALVNSSEVWETRFGRELLSDASDGMFRGWNDRLSWLGKGFDIHVKGDKEVQDFLTLVELRNALVHHGSSLTKKQSRDTRELLELESRLHSVLGVEAHTGRLVFSAVVPTRAIEVSIDLVFHVDERIRRTHPSVRF